jgi:pseudaminic acid cytidylyltransferase
MRLCVIPARGGSKRIPRKNIKNFHGKPIIQYSIEVALESSVFDKVIVSTDDEEIAEVAKSGGAEIPFIRPQSLADEFTATVPVISHAVQEMENRGFQFNFVCCIYATSPFLKASYIKQGAEIISEGNTDYVFSSAVYPHPIERSFELNEERRVTPFMPGQERVRSQDLIEKYHDAGQFYWGTRGAWVSEKNIFTPNSETITLPSYLVQDIDTPEDWKRAEVMWVAVNNV